MVLSRKGAILLTALALAVCATPVLLAQGTTGVLSGRVTSEEGDYLPGVSVTISSPALQGTRQAWTDQNGAYRISALPPGPYEVLFELDGLTEVQRQVTVSLAQASRVDIAMSIAAVSETITVVNTLSTLDTAEVSQNITYEVLDDLPINRTITGATTIAPGVSPEGPNDQIMISGAPSYENLYLLNGAVVNENVRGQPQSLFIEDAIQETTVLTGNISAEYGRLTGGVVNTITKQGGNDFSGSLRNSLTNDDWTRLTPFPGEAEHEDQVNDRWEATFGGRIVRDKLWFFAAGRLEETSEARNTRDTNLPYEFNEDEDRYEVKLTGQLTASHALVGSFLDREIAQDGRGFGSITDLRSLDDRTLPYSLLSLSYTGIFGSSWLAEVQYSEREFSFVNSGANTRDLIDGTILRGFAGSRRAWSPTFCGICGDRSRNNELFQLKGSYFLSTSELGSHDLIGGYEDFSELRDENNEQGGSGYRLWGNFRHPDGATFIHVDPGQSYLQFFPVLERSVTSDGNTKSFYVNDQWTLNDHWSFNLGVRFDQNKSLDQAGAVTADDEKLSPRLSATYDLKGDGKHRFIASFSEYTANIDNGVNDEASSAGAPANFSWFYRGPEINAPSTPDGALLTSDQVLEQVFDWFFNVNCPGLSGVDVLQCQNNLRSTSLPGVNRQIADGGLSSPSMREFTFGYGYQIGGQGYIRATFIDREWSDFYVRTDNLANGTVFNNLGQEFDLRLIGTDDRGLVREYQSVQVQGGYRFTSNFSIRGNYTWSNLEGNAITEVSNSATDSINSIDSFPEYLDFSWNRPERALDGDVEHRLNLWVSYNLNTRFGNFNFSVLELFHTGFPYYASGTIDLREIPNPGFISPPTTATYFFRNTEEFRTDDIHRTDLAINYSIPFSRFEFFVQADILNVFDESGIQDPNGLERDVLTSRNSTCRQADGSRCLRFNPMTTTPVEGVHFQLDPNFGEPNDESAYQLPLTYRFSVGFRF